MSWDDPEREFLDHLMKLGFRAIPARHGFLWEFTHPDSGPRRYAMSVQENYGRALTRFEDELRKIQVHTAFREAAIR